MKMEKNLKKKLLGFLNSEEGKNAFQSALNAIGGADDIKDLYKTIEKKDVPLEKITEYVHFLVFVKNFEHEHGEKSVMQLVNQYFNL
jgi:hypothetical protein